MIFLQLTDTVTKGFEYWGAFGFCLLLLALAILWFNKKNSKLEEDKKELLSQIADLNKELRTTLLTNQDVLTKATETMRSTLDNMIVVPEKVRAEVMAIIGVVNEKAKTTHDKLNKILEQK